MALKTIKFDLPIGGVKVRSIAELQEHFTREIIVGLTQNAANFPHCASVDHLMDHA